MHFTTAQALKQQELRNQAKLAKQKEIAEAVDERFDAESKTQLDEEFSAWSYAESSIKSLQKQVESSMREMTAAKENAMDTLRRMEEVPKEKGLPLSKEEVAKLKKMMMDTYKRMMKHIRNL